MLILLNFLIHPEVNLLATPVIDEDREAHHDEEGDQGAQKTIDANVVEVLEEPGFFKVVASFEDNLWQETVEKYFLAESFQSIWLYEVYDCTDGHSNKDA